MPADAIDRRSECRARGWVKDVGLRRVAMNSEDKNKYNEEFTKCTMRKEVCEFEP